MKIVLTLICFIAFFIPAHAESQKLNGAEIMQLLNDKIIYNVPGASTSEQIFQKSGVTFFSESGNQSQGNWNIQGDKYCSVWPPSQTWVCYDMTRDGNTLNFISPSGKISAYSIVK